MKLASFSPFTLKVVLAGLIVFCAVLAVAGAVFATTVPGGEPSGPTCTAHPR
jgi:hypothetical protein